MASLKLARIPLALLMALLFLTIIATSSHTTFAHSASSHTAFARNASPASLFTGIFRVNGKQYALTLGVPLQVPVTWKDGSKGYAVVTLGMTGSAQPGATKTGGFVSLVPLISCTTLWVGILGENIIHYVLTSYTLFQHYCYTNSSPQRIYSADAPYEQSYGNIGWSLANHAEWDAYVYADTGEADGRFRFNGPAGVGCKSGYAQIFFYYDGTGSADAGFDSQFGC